VRNAGPAHYPFATRPPLGGSECAYPNLLFRAGLRPNFGLGTRLFSVRHLQNIFGIAECLGRACLRKVSAKKGKNRRKFRNPVDGGLTQINFLIPLMRELL
jgi:hypothetical protein